MDSYYYIVMAAREQNELGNSKLLLYGWTQVGDLWRDPWTGKLFQKKWATNTLKCRQKDPAQAERLMNEQKKSESGWYYVAQAIRNARDFTGE